MDLNLYNHALHLIHTSRHMVALTGAGVSVDSGVPTFRGTDGLWTRYDPEIHAGISGFRSDPKRSWEFFIHLFEILDDAIPNSAHLALAHLEKAHILKCTITQNIDSLHSIAGQNHVIEIHGNMRNLVCTTCLRTYSTKGMLIDKQDLPPACECGGFMKPDAVLFGEALPSDRCFAALEQIRSADILLLAGTSGFVHPVNEFPEIALRHGARIIEINIARTVLTTQFDTLFLEGPAGEVLQRMTRDLLSTGDPQEQKRNHAD